MTAMYDTAAKPAADAATGSSSPADAREALVNAVDVEIETYLGGARVNIGELNALDAGSVLTLDAALNADVELRVNGCTIATGELVAVGDRFGVRIKSLAP